MMKLILFVLFSDFVLVQSKITAKNKTLLIKAGDPFTLECDDPSAKWKLNAKVIANCENCHSSACNIDEAYKNRITAFCKQGYSVLHFNSTQIKDKGSLQCPESGTTTFQLLVGNYNITHFRSENKFPFALNQKSYTLVCDKEQNGEMIWYYETNNISSYFDKDCFELVSDYDKNRFDITCDAKQKKGTFHIKQVSLSQDGNIIGCETAGQLYLFRLTVNVPVTSVSIQLQSQDLIENKDGIFVCKVEESKPEVSFQWIIAYRNGSLQKIQQKSSISKTAKGKLWQTSSTLILKLKRDYKKIMCKARIENMPWTNAKYKLLDIKYPPQGKPRIILSQSRICAGKSTEIKCEWKGGYPEAIVKLSCLSEVKEGQSSVSIKKTVTQEMSQFCICKGMHIDKEDNVIEELDIQYPPNKVTIRQTSYLEGQTASLICVASGGNPEVYNYTWSPGNYPPANVIKINLTRALNKKTLTCNGHHKCNPVSSTIKLNVEFAAHFQGNKNETGIVGSEKLLKICFYCNPDATDVKWYKGNEEMSFDRISYIPAEDGLFPFLGNCSILKLDINEKEIQNYSLKVINPVGEKTFELTLATVIPSNSSTEPPIYIIVSSVTAVIVLLIIIGGIVYFILRRSSKKTQSNSNTINNLRMSNGQEDGHEPHYAEISDILPVEGEENGNKPQCIDLTSRPPVAGEVYRKEPQYIDMTNGKRNKGKVNGNEPVYMNVANRSPVKGHLDYEDLGN